MPSQEVRGLLRGGTFLLPPWWLFWGRAQAARLAQQPPLPEPSQQGLYLIFTLSSPLHHFLIWGPQCNNTVFLTSILSSMIPACAQPVFSHFPNNLFILKNSCEKPMLDALVIGKNSIYTS